MMSIVSRLRDMPKLTAPKARTRPAATTGGSEPPRPAADGQRPRGFIEIATSDAVTRALKTSERVARDVAHDIIAQRLSPGDSLPAEAAMLEHYGVSRESLREGLRLLEVQGLISIRRGPGGGPVVGAVDPANLGRISTLYYHMSGATYRELFEAWQLSEGILAERAARNPDAARRQALMAPYLGDADAVSTPEQIDEYVQSQTKFHTAIGSLAGNRVLELSLQVFGQIVTHHVAVLDDPRTLASEIAHDHHRLARAVVAGHSTRARTIMEEHIGSVAAFTEAHLGSTFDDFIEWL